MRYMDWDVLLFPHGSHIPIKEFRVACYLQQERLDSVGVPILTAFVPSLPDHTPFQVSVHSWVKPQAILGGNNAGYAPGTTYQWRVNVKADGKVLSSETFAEDVTWPKQIDKCSTPPGGDPSVKVLLTFPVFDKRILSQSHWNACDDQGRIKVELSAGYQFNGGYINLVDHVIFAFQPAPMELLQRSGIAWPHANMPIVSNPLHSAADPRPQPLHLDDDGASRSSSSTYSSYPPSAYHFGMPSTFATHPPTALSLNSHAWPPNVPMRLPSDQLQLILDKIQCRSASDDVSSNVMPPPPVPLRNMGPDRRGEPSRFSDISMHADCTSYPHCVTEDPDGHVLHEPPSANMPSPAPLGKKEGNTTASSPPIAKSRDFMSTVMDAPPPPPPNSNTTWHSTSPAPSTADSSSATITMMMPPPPPTPNAASFSSTSPAPITTDSSSAKKRTRSALRSLTLNDGSPGKKTGSGKSARKQSRTSSSTSASDRDHQMVD